MIPGYDRVVTGGNMAEFVKTAEIVAHRNNRVNMIRGKRGRPAHRSE